MSIPDGIYGHTAKWCAAGNRGEINAMLMSVFERIRELGIMKAMGVTPWQLTLLIYAETMIQVTVASIIAFLEKTGFWQITSGEIDMSFQS